MPRDETTPSHGRRRTRRPKGRARTGRRLFAFDREQGSRYVAGADEAGRGSLAGPLVAAAVLFDLERLTLGGPRAPARRERGGTAAPSRGSTTPSSTRRPAARSCTPSYCAPPPRRRW